MKLTLDGKELEQTYGTLFHSVPLVTVGLPIGRESLVTSSPILGQPSATTL